MEFSPIATGGRREEQACTPLVSGRRALEQELAVTKATWQEARVKRNGKGTRGRSEMILKA